MVLCLAACLSTLVPQWDSSSLSLIEPQSQRKFPRDHIANICWVIEKVKELKKKKPIHLCFINYDKAFDCVDHNKLWKALKEMGTPDHVTCFLRNLYASQEATVRTLDGTTVWFKIEKEVWQGCLLSPCLCNLYDEHIMRKARLDEL